MNKSFVPFVCAAALLSSCYSNVNQAWFRKQYEGYQFDYVTDAPAGIRGLPPVLYRCGEDWYIAAIKSDVHDHDPYVHCADEPFMERHRFELTQHFNRPVWYHKITPAMAELLLVSDQTTNDYFTSAHMMRDLRHAGGEWLPQLPAGAKPVPSEFFKYAKVSVDYVRPLDTASPWYAYPLAGLTFLCIDLPFAVATNGAIAYALLRWGWLDDDDEDDNYMGPPPPPKKKPSAPPAAGNDRPHEKHHHHHHSEHGGHKDHHCKKH